MSSENLVRSIINEPTTNTQLIQKIIDVYSQTIHENTQKNKVIAIYLKISVIFFGLSILFVIIYITYLINICT
jgi:hypothetical protein